jgi:hypothetical protein
VAFVGESYCTYVDKMIKYEKERYFAAAEEINGLFCGTDPVFCSQLPIEWLYSKGRDGIQTNKEEKKYGSVW